MLGYFADYLEGYRFWHERLIKIRSYYNGII